MLSPVAHSFLRLLVTSYTFTEDAVEGTEFASRLKFITGEKKSSFS